MTVDQLRIARLLRQVIDPLISRHAGARLQSIHLRAPVANARFGGRAEQSWP
jgi:hypothetical protein